ncbi:MAG: hypothetical protein HFI45_18130 [Lachnospiraceae bacterium]|nr:hypothetical protein [Lachnospiraceae bacterium]
MCDREKEPSQRETNYVKVVLWYEINCAVADGYICFISGYEEGVDSDSIDINKKCIYNNKR